MRKRVIVLAVVGVLVVGLAVASAVLTGGNGDALRAKQGVAPSLALPSGGFASSSTTGRKAGAKTSDAAISWFTVAKPASLDIDLRDLPAVPNNPLPSLPEFEQAQTEKQATELGSPAPRLPGGLNAPTAGTNFAGLGFSTAVTGGQAGAGYPPDTNGDVGKNYFIQTVNTAAGIYNKSTGLAAAKFTLNSLWTGAATGTPCDTVHNGDPVALYDPMADRFFITDFSWTDLQNGPYYECIAVSKTSDPVSGGWWLYAVRADDASHPWLNDYPKLGIWPDGLYITYNMFDCQSATCNPGPFQEVRAQALPRTTMEAGGAITVITADTGSTTYFALTPSNMRSATGAPPAGRENLLVTESQTLFAWHVFKFHADFVTPGLSTFTGPTNVSQTSYTVAPTTVPTPANALDTLRERVMVQNQYTNLSGVESLWVNHTVRTGASPAPAGIQWSQIGVTGGAVVSPPVQQQIYGNVGADGINRWMGSLAVDKSGNMALGYSAANVNNNPSIRFTGRLFGDGLGTLQAEATMISGGGAQNNTCGGATCIRWGDYSGMTLDPDGCTFWYTTEYYAANGGDWQTRIGNMSYAPNNCTPIGPTSVSVSRLLAVRTKQGVAVTWRTGTEARIAGFQVLRQNSAGRWVKVSRGLIAAKHAGQAGGASYRFLDRTALKRAAYNYRLQVVAATGKASPYGLAAVAAGR